MALPTSLTTLAAIKARLQLPTDADPQDDVLEALREAVEERILDKCGFALESALPANSTVTETQIDVQLGRSRLMRLRPILPLSSNPTQEVQLQARSMASSTFNSIIGELRDPWQGRIMPLASELTPVFPPIGGLAPWFRWRQMIWPVVKFKYKVDPLGSSTNPLPKALISAAIEWTVSIYARAGSGAIASVSLERVSESYVDSSEPPVVRMLLTKYIRDKAVMVD